MSKQDSRQRKPIIKNGYEYTLVLIGDRRNLGGKTEDTPNFMGNYGWALSSIKKIDNLKI